MVQTETSEPVASRHVGIYGWRKRCLYLVLLLLLIIITVNLTLVLWIVKVLTFSTHGMSYINMVGSGIQFTGKTFIQDTLVASGLFTRPGETFSVQSAKNLSLTTTDRLGYLSSNIYLGDGKLEISTPTFKVTDLRGKTLFSVDKDAVSLTAHSLSISGEGGAVFEGSLQTPVVSADVRSDLELEAAFKGVQVVTPAGVSIESRAGDILASSHHDINLITVEGSIKLESTNVLMPSLPHRTLNHHRPRKHHHHHVDRIYQLCVCSSGELYLGEADSVCEASSVCR
ncbi:delta-sarcoglycan-like [Homalodisca vitripennis]|uniref:delta-sarcoglycan-like n=1 Tax=Homalodisca vitripennis TaxID=197043 RepID=UPI001EEC4106|nr:delta-sarcoglycan-like [Homalodisca vitripennis]KAG8245208.1 hypothetical protein J6590_009286 [Homalodisca vitripennis]